MGITKKIKRLRRTVNWAVRNFTARRRIAAELNPPREPVADLARYERRIRSQNGEDGILEAIFALVGTESRYFVEFGVGSGRTCNTALLRKRGWGGLWMDILGSDALGALVKRERINAGNINALFEKYSVPAAFDLLSIDIDGNDYWVWKAIRARPRVVVIEYNATIPPNESRTIAYDPDFQWQRNAYYGASLLALQRLGEEKGYQLVGCDSQGVNAFFVRRELAEERFLPQSVETLYRSGARRYRPDPEREMVEV